MSNDTLKTKYLERIGGGTTAAASGTQQKRESSAQTGMKPMVNQATQAYKNYQTQQPQPQGTGGGASTYDPYLAQANALYEQLMNRGAFKWDMQADDVYRQYEDMYTNAGNLAMKDAMGTAAGLTGGYGNSYASLVGNQANQAYMTQLAAMIPELEDRAYQRWLGQGDELMSQYELALSRASLGGGSGTGDAETSYGIAGLSGVSSMLPSVIERAEGYDPDAMQKAVAAIQANGGLNWNSAMDQIMFDYYNKDLGSK